MTYGRNGYARPAQRSYSPDDPRPVPEDNARFNDVPPGSYALWNKANERWHFFTVNRPDHGKWLGWTFLKEHIGENRNAIRGQSFQLIMNHIRSDPERAMRNYGVESGVCGKCGKELTDPDSIADGIGPVCKKNLGW